MPAPARRATAAASTDDRHPEALARSARLDRLLGWARRAAPPRRCGRSRLRAARQGSGGARLPDEVSGQPNARRGLRQAERKPRPGGGNPGTDGPIVGAPLVGARSAMPLGCHHPRKLVPEQAGRVIEQSRHPAEARRLPPPLMTVTLKRSRAARASKGVTRRRAGLRRSAFRLVRGHRASVASARAAGYAARQAGDADKADAPANDNRTDGVSAAYVLARA
jgi:hypothetical protein